MKNKITRTWKVALAYGALSLEGVDLLLSIRACNSTESQFATIWAKTRNTNELKSFVHSDVELHCTSVVGTEYINGISIVLEFDASSEQEDLLPTDDVFCKMLVSLPLRLVHMLDNASA